MIELDTIYNEDCIEGMKRIGDASVDCIICDLPYGVLHKNNPHAQWDRQIPFEPLWEQYERIIKSNGAILLFGQGMFTAHLMMSNPKLW
ncbi:MAG: site-specific DNA-methyltransferase, partial [Bacteroidaceae bacterium]|nr:site-specific DNA-methyltransferase [Bacteroidaceae bacterium]